MPAGLCDAPQVKSNTSFPLAEVESCRSVPEFREPLEPTYSPELRAGFVLDGRFELLEAVTRSGMATIYRALDRRSGEVVAVKIPQLRYESDPAFFSRFQREEQIGQKLRHPFILKFIAVDGPKSRPYIVTEYLHGSTLAQVLSLRQVMPEADALRIASLLCEALHYLHSQGVVHRDLKPSNVMICCDGGLRLMDFGIAADAGVRRITMAGFSSMMGTPDYMAPEQVRNKKVDQRTDIYGLGTVLYEMLTGIVPFENENPWVAMNNRVNGDPVAPRSRNPKISPQAEEIVLHAMQRNPDDRYQNAMAMKTHLDAPEKIKLTGYCDRLVAPRWRLGLRETPVIAGALLGLGFIALQMIVFLMISLHLKK